MYLSILVHRVVKMVSVTLVLGGNKGEEDMYEEQC